MLIEAKYLSVTGEGLKTLIEQQMKDYNLSCNAAYDKVSNSLKQLGYKPSYKTYSSFYISAYHQKRKKAQ